MIDKDLFLKPHLPEQTVAVAGVEVRIRGLSRQEMFQINELGSKDEQEVFCLAAGLVDPKLTEAEIRQWRENAPSGEVDEVSTAIMMLSATDQDALKAAVRRFRDEPGNEA